MILITHTDLDGVGCAIVARFFYPELKTENIYHCEYNTVEAESKRLLQTTDDKILMTDLSVKEETAAWIDTTYPGRFELFDHHFSAIQYLQHFAWAVLDMKRCATKLFFDTLKERMPGREVPEALEKFVFHVNDVDLWIHDSPLSRDLNDMLHLLGIPLFAALLGERIRKNMPLIEQSDERYLHGLKGFKKQYFHDRVQEAVVDGNRLIVLASRHISDLAQYIRDIENPPESWKNVDYIDVVNLEAKVHSLRSYNDNFDVSAIAQAKGGGGHKKAAGYPIQFPEKLWFLQF